MKHFQKTRTTSGQLLRRQMHCSLKPRVLRATKIKQWWSLIGVNISDVWVEICIQE